MTEVIDESPEKTIKNNKFYLLLEQLKSNIIKSRTYRSGCEKNNFPRYFLLNNFHLKVRLEEWDKNVDFSNVLYCSEPSGIDIKLTPSSLMEFMVIEKESAAHLIGDLNSSLWLAERDKGELDHITRKLLIRNIQQELRLTRCVIRFYKLAIKEVHRKTNRDQEKSLAL
jgi:hypothetical protein